jgi:hypothetical protein
VSNQGKVKVFGFKIKDPNSGLYLSKSGAWTSVGGLWTRRHNAINAVKAKLKRQRRNKVSGADDDAALGWELVCLVEGESESLLFYIDKLAK